jgi:hypothetical protein
MSSLSDGDCREIGFEDIKKIARARKILGSGMRIAEYKEQRVIKSSTKSSSWD